MTQEQLHIGVHAIVDRVHHEMRDAAAELLSNSLQLQLGRVDDRVVGADTRQKARDAFCKRALFVLADEERDGCVGDDDLLHAVEELLTADRLGADPHLLFPVAHGVGVGGSVLVARADEVVRQIGPLAVESDCLFRVLICPGVRSLFYLCQREGEMGLDLAVVLLIGGELAVFVHEIG